MSAGSSSPAHRQAPAIEPRTFVQWLLAGAAGVAVLFALSAHFSVSDRSPGVFGIVLGVAAGWGLGRWAAVMHLQASAALAVASCFCIISGEALAALKTNSDRVARLSAQPAMADPLTEAGRRFLAEGQPGESAESREKRLETLQELERGDAVRRQHLTFGGYLTSRIPREWGRWEPPWPALFWTAEVLIAGALGTLTALYTVLVFTAPDAHGNGEKTRNDPPE